MNTPSFNLTAQERNDLRTQAAQRGPDDEDTLNVCRGRATEEMKTSPIQCATGKLGESKGFLEGERRNEWWALTLLSNTHRFQLGYTVGSSGKTTQNIAADAPERNAGFPKSPLDSCYHGHALNCAP